LTATPRQAAVLAFRLLTHDKVRLAASIGGVTFAVFLMLLQIGFRNAILDTVVELLDVLDADIIVAGKGKRYMLDSSRIPRQRLFQARSATGVAAAYPFTFTARAWKNLESGLERPVRLVAVAPDDPLFLRDDIRGSQRGLDSPDTALLNRRSRPYLGRLTTGPAQIERRMVRVIDTFAFGTDADADGTVIVSEETLYRFGWRPELIEMVVVKTAPGASTAAVAASLRSILPMDVLIHTKAQLREKDYRYWSRVVPIGILVGIGVIMGFIVGVAICYQILYTEISDHLTEFATLKAIGYQNAYLTSVVLAEATFISLAAFVPGALLSAIAYAALAASTGLVVRLGIGSLAEVLALTVGMCVAAGVLALRPAFQTDPARLFR
jgi:putative ABC transport system permease protein